MRRNRKSNSSPAQELLAGIFAVCFGIFWTVLAGSIFPPMAIFGILWTAIAGAGVYNSYKAAKAQKSESPAEAPEQKSLYEPPEELRCPYCGAPIHRNDSRCEYCGSRL